MQIKHIKHKSNHQSWSNSQQEFSSAAFSSFDVFEESKPTLLKCISTLAFKLKDMIECIGNCKCYIDTRAYAGL